MSSPRRPRRALLVSGIVAVVVLLALLIGLILTIVQQREGNEVPDDGQTSTPAATPTPTPEPLTPAEALLATTDDPAACAVTFAGEGISGEPLLQTAGTLFHALPIPSAEGRVFAGWYDSEDAAARFAIEQRINGSDTVACPQERQLTLYASWKSPEENAAENTRVPILMYHQFTQNPEGENGWLRGNYAFIGDFDAQMAHIADSGFYLPTWDELSAFIDGRVSLPPHSVIVTDDDADQSWFDLAAPVVEKYGVMSTSFMVTIDRQDPPPSRFVLRRSHTHDMHRAGPNGEGLMVNATAEEIAADLRTSAEVLGVGEVVAYPYGHYNDTTKQGVAMAGYELGRTIDPGYVTIGTDKLALPVIRINYGMTVDDLIAKIG